LAGKARVAVFVDWANFYNRLRQCRWPTQINAREPKHD
jgi:hypothetical protein